MEKVLTDQLIQETLSSIHSISTETARNLLKCTKILKLKKGDFLEKEKQPIRNEYIVVEGIVRLFLLDKKGNEFTINFYQSGQPIAPTLLRSLNFISFVNIQVISSKASVMIFSNELMQKLMNKNQDLEIFGYKVMMIEAFKKAEREKILLTADGIEKLEWLRANYPNLENEVPHYYIASFLGLTPTSLSRLRSQKC
ncbi:Crp/Fnr family transcriptional regulator [Raineya sp.]|jgi:CRP-like cAMP-binding protein